MTSEITIPPKAMSRAEFRNLVYGSSAWDRFVGGVRRMFGRSTIVPDAQSKGLASALRVFGAGGSAVSGGALLAYSRIPALRRVVDKIANDCASVPLRAYRKPRNMTVRQAQAIVAKANAVRDPKRRAKILDEGELVAVEGHPALAQLERPSPGYTAHRLFEVTFLHLLLVGEAFWYLTEPSDPLPGQRRVFKGITPIVPSSVTEVPGSRDDFFRVSQRDGRETKVDPADMVWFKKANPADPEGRGCGMGNTLADELSLDEYAAKTAKAIFENDGTPPLLVMLKGLDESGLKAMESNWLQHNTGYRRKGLPFFTSADVDVQQLRQSLVDLRLIEARDSTRDRIREAYGVPPEILGQVENSNRATITQARRIYANNVLTPLLNLSEEQLNADLMPTLGFVDTVLLFDDPSEQDGEFALEIADKAPWLATVDEHREALGLAKREDEIGGGLPLGSADRIVAATLEATAGPTFGVDPRATSTEPSEDKAAAKIAKAIEAYRAVSADRDTILAIANAASADDLAEPLSKLYEVEATSWARDIADKIGDALSPEQLANLAANEVNAVRRSMAGVNRTTQESIRSAISTGIRKQETLEQITDRVQDTFRDAETWRAEMIARTEVTRATGSTTHNVHSELGVKRRVWAASFLNTRDSHAALDGQVEAIDKPFRSGSGATAMHPGGFGVASEDVNCQCFVEALREDRSTPLTQIELRAIEAKQLEKSEPWRDKTKRELRSGFAKQEEAVLTELKRRLG